MSLDLTDEYQEDSLLFDAERPKRTFEICIIDDDILDAQLLIRQLSDMPEQTYTTSYFDSVAHFLSVKTAEPDVIFLDRHISAEGLSESLIPQIKAACKKAAVILYTGTVTPSLVASAAHFGAFGTIQKGELSCDELTRVTHAACNIGTLLNRQNPVLGAVAA